MLQIGLIKCPKCRKMVNQLEFWKKVGEYYFHLCNECKNIPLCEDDLLLIGFFHGRSHFKQEIKDFLS